MTRRSYLTLALMGLAVYAVIAAFQTAPGYMDADYYYAGGLQIAAGKGFSEPYLWNYLDDPAGLPHPSHGYWMPLASIIAALGAFLFGPASWLAARIGFLAVAAAIPPLTAALAWSLTSRRDLALVSGLLAVFAGFYIPYLSVTDTFGLYALLGGLFFLIFGNPRLPVGLKALFLGLLAGLMHLTRADGLLWLLMAFTAVFLLSREQHPRRPLVVFVFSFAVLSGYLLVMGPWFFRNLSVFGSPFAPGSARTLWLTSYDQTFAYPASQLTFASWWESGLASILKARLWAFGVNFTSAFAVQGGIFLFPLILVGAWRFHRDGRVQMALIAWGLTLLIMTFVFPFAGARGGFFHSGSALQPLWWALAPIGLEKIVAWLVRWRKWKNESGAQNAFRTGVLLLSVLLTIVIAWGRVIGGYKGEQAWGRSERVYMYVDWFLSSQGANPDDVVIVANPPGFYLASGHPAITVPDGDAHTVLELARRYEAKYLILEDDKVTKGLEILYQQPGSSAGFYYLGEVEGARVFAITP